jgi:hypothetical protein
MLVAVPAAAAIQVFVRHWLATYRASAIYGTAPRTAAPGGETAVAASAPAPAPAPASPSGGGEGSQ